MQMHEDRKCEHVSKWCFSSEDSYFSSKMGDKVLILKLGGRGGVRRLRGEGTQYLSGEREGKLPRDSEDRRRWGWLMACLISTAVSCAATFSLQRQEQGSGEVDSTKVRILSSKKDEIRGEEC